MRTYPGSRARMLTSTALVGGILAAALGHTTSAQAACDASTTGTSICTGEDSAIGKTATGSLEVQFNNQTVTDGGVSLTANGNPYDLSLTVQSASGPNPITNNAGTGISLLSGGGSVSLTTLAGAPVHGSTNGMSLSTTGAGTIMVTAGGAITAATGHGIQAIATGAGGITIDTGAAGTINAGGNGIMAEASTGPITITTGAAIAAAGDHGISSSTSPASTANTKITANADVSGRVIGINATAFGTGSITVGGSGHVTGGIHGILAQNLASTTSGDLVVTGSGDTTGSGGFGIAAITSFGNNANIVIDRSGNVAGVTTGIYAFTMGSGDVTITGIGNVTARNTASDYGILATTAGGDVTVSVNGSVSAGNGIAAATSGNGTVSVTTRDVTATAGDAITAGAQDGRITVRTNGAISATAPAANGIKATAFGAGAVEISTTGTINAGGTGIVAQSSAGPVTVTAGGAIAAGTGHGINAATGGAGGITIDTGAAGTINAGGNGIMAEASTGPITITTGAAIAAAGDHGISSSTSPASTANTKITANADVSGRVIGINATAFGTGSITVGGSGHVTGGIHGILAQNLASTTSGDLVVTGSGDTTGSGGFGIAAITSFGNNANIVIDRSGNVAGVTTGIYAFTMGSGDVTITGIGNVTARNMASDYGILATTAGGDVTVSVNGSVSAGNGIAAATSGNGTVSVTTHDVTATAGDAITAGTQDGRITVRTNGAISATAPAANGIKATAFGAGAVEISTTGTINAGGTGIVAQSSAGPVTITAGGPVSAATGIRAQTSGASTIAVSVHDVTATNGTGIELIGGTSNTVINAGIIDAVTGITTTTGSTAVTNDGAIIARGGTAIQFGGSANTLTLMTASVIRGTVLGTGTDTLRLGGSGVGAFDATNLGAGQQYQGFASLDKVDGARWILTGTSGFSGPTNVLAGDLWVNGSLANSAVTVDSGGTLGGSGTVGALMVRGGARVAPGNSIGTLTAAGPLLLSPGAIYQAEIDAAGRSDRIVTTGAATVTGAGVAVSATPGGYLPNQTYTILSAQGGINGEFGGVTSNLTSTFLAPTLSYDPHNVYLTLLRNAVTFDSVGRTQNQRATGTALDDLARGAAYLAVVNGTADGARYAFDALSGEVHASAQSAMIENNKLIRDAVIDRLRQHGGATTTGALAPTTAAASALGAEPDRIDGAFAALGYASPPNALTTKGPVSPPRVGPRWATWAQGVGNWSRFDGDGNAAAMTTRTGGILAGVDATLDDTWRIGVAGGYSQDTLSVSERRSSATIENYHVALYGGGRAGALGLRFGAAHTWHDLDVTRSVVFGSSFEEAKSDYRAGTTQVFGDVGYALRFGAIAAEPFAALAYVHLGNDGFTESGASAGLRGQDGGTDTTFSTVGLRFAGLVAITETAALVARGTLGWRHAYGDVVPTTQMTFNNGGPAFTIAGVPIARDAALLEAGLDLAVSPAATFGLAYTGQLAEDAHSHAVKGSLLWRF